jgi:hypothetical protein
MAKSKKKQAEEVMTTEIPPGRVGVRRHGRVEEARCDLCGELYTEEGVSFIYTHPWIGFGELEGWVRVCPNCLTEGPHGAGERAGDLWSDVYEEITETERQLRWLEERSAYLGFVVNLLLLGDDEWASPDDLEQAAKTPLQVW